MALAPGDLIAQKYRIVRKLGEGSMGVVYAGVHELLKTQVALKFLHKDLAEKPGLAARFLQEAQVAARIRSPHVAAVWDADTWSGMPFMVMEFLEGETLRQLLDREHKLSLGKTVDFGAQILLGLEAAHALSVVHRDLKPDNVFVTQEREGVVLKLIDFGIAKLRQADPGSKGLTEAGMILGTPEYMAPEQIAEAAKVDHRADVYSVGAMLYEMLSGHTVVERTSLEATLIAVQMGQIRPLGELEPTLPKGLEAIVMRALRLEREDRFPSAFALRQALAPFAVNQSQIGERALSAPAIALGTQPLRAVNLSDVPVANPAAPPLGATVRVAPTLIEQEIARASTFPVHRASANAAQAEVPGYATSAAHAQVPGYPTLPRGRKPARSNAPLIILGAIALLLGVAIGIVLFMQRDSKPNSTLQLPPNSEATTSSTAVVQPEFSRPEVPTPSPTAYPPPYRPQPTGPRSTEPGGAVKPPPTQPPIADAGDAQADAGTPPFTIPLPSGLPSGFPTAITIPTALPSGFPTALPPFPGFPQPQSPPSPPADAGQPVAPQ